MISFEIMIKTDIHINLTVSKLIIMCWKNYLNESLKFEYQKMVYCFFLHRDRNSKIDSF